MIQLHNCVSHLWQKWNYCTPNEKPLCCWTYQIIPRDLWLIKEAGPLSSFPQDGKCMSPRAKRRYCWSTQEQTVTCATPLSPHQPRWRVYWHLQVSFYFWTKRHGPKFPVAPLVPHSAAVSRYPQHAAHLPPPHPYVFLHTHEWPFRLQRHAHGATWN